VAALLCARLCHDLSGPLGALIGVIDIAREEQPASETIAFAEETVGELTQRLRLLRAAWPEGLGLSLTDDAAACEALLADPRRLQAPLTVLLARRAGLQLSVLMPPAGRV